MDGQVKTRVWIGPDVFTVIRRAHAAAERVSDAKPKRLQAWGARVDAYVREHYDSLGPAQIARDLSLHYKRKYTKNMVISRYHRIKQ